MTTSERADDLRALLNQVHGVRDACDLDLLLFFARHGCSLLTNEQIVASLGYDLQRIATSIEALIGASLLSRSEKSARAARMYVLQLHGSSGRSVSSLLKLAATRTGRQEVMRLLAPELAGTPLPDAGIIPAHRTTVEYFKEVDNAGACTRSG